MRFAAVADIHGNRWAMEAVLEELERRSVPEVVNLGDCLYGPIDPGGTFDLLRRRRWSTVRGNQERILLEPAPTPPNRTYEMVMEQLGTAGIEWVKGETRDPFTAHDAFLCHGTPERDNECLVEYIERDAVRVRNPMALAAALNGVTESLVLCGHSHVPRLVTTSDGVTIVNPGSVGLPAYEHDEPFAHAMESGSPHARFAIIEPDDSGWRIEHLAIPYDHEAAAQAARRHKRLDWHHWLSTGRARPGA